MLSYRPAHAQSNLSTGVPRILDKTVPPHLKASSEPESEWNHFASYLETARINVNVRQGAALAVHEMTYLTPRQFFLEILFLLDHSASHLCTCRNHEVAVLVNTMQMYYWRLMILCA